MKFSQIQSNGKVISALAGMVDSGKVPHSILFHEEDGGDAFAICLAFLQYLYCKSHVDSDSCGTCPQCNKIDKLIHPDVHFIFPTTSSTISEQYIKQFRTLVSSNPHFTENELADALGIEGKKSLIAVGEAKHLLDVLSMSALEGGYRSVVIYLPELMNPEAANRLLKMVEEPPVQTQFLFITHHPEKVLQTISSRCQLIRVLPTRDASVAFTDPELFNGLMDSLASRDFYACLEVADKLAALPSRDIAGSFCKFAAFRMRGIFLSQQGLPSDGDADCVRWASALPKSFPRRALAEFDSAARMIQLNVNLRILFTDLVSKLYIF